MECADSEFLGKYERSKDVAREEEGEEEDRGPRSGWRNAVITRARGFTVF